MRHTVQIIDDEELAVTLLENYISDSNLDLDVLPSAYNVDDAIKVIDQYDPDIILLDIKINEKTGFDVLKGISHKPLVIFTTAFDNFAIKAIKNDAVDYVMKPIDKTELVAALKKAMKLNAKKKEINDNHSSDESRRRIKITNGELVLINDIIHCQAEGNYSRVFLSDGRDVLMAKTLKKLEQEINSISFFRTHQSHLINMNYCEAVHTGSVSLSGFPNIPISRSRKQSFLDALK